MTSSSSTAVPPPSFSIETLRERILTGGGTANARGSLAKVAGHYARFVQTLGRRDAENDGEGTSSSASAAAARALQTELLLHELEMRKLILASKASDRNSSRYSAALSRMGTSLTETRGDIESLASTLASERRVKRNREEYDALAKMGNEKNPPMRETRMELERVQKEMDGVEEEVKEARRDLSVKERQMRLFLASLGDLKATLKEEETTKKDASSPLPKGKKRKHNTSDANLDRSYHSNDDNIGAL